MNRIVGLFFACLVLMSTVGLVFAQTTQMNMEPAPSQDKAAGASAKVSMDKVKLLMAQANEAMLKGDEARANELLGQVVEIARQAWDLGDVTTSEAIFRQVLNLKSDNPDALLGLAELYRRINPIWAVEYYTRYKAINPSDPAVYYGRGSCYLARDAYALAIEDLQYLVDRLEPNHIGGLTNLALAYRGRAVEKNYDPSLFEQAVRYMKQAVSVAESSTEPDIQKMLPELQYRLGRLSFEHQQILARAQVEQANFDDAIGSLESSVQGALDVSKKNPEDAEALNQALLSYDAISEIYNAKAALAPGDSQPYLELAKIAAQRSEILVRQSLLTSLGYVEKAIDVDPKVAGNWAALADLYTKLDDVKNSIKAIDKAVSIEPDNMEYKAKKAKLVASTQPSTKPAKKD